MKVVKVKNMIHKTLLYFKYFSLITCVKKGAGE